MIYCEYNYHFKKLKQKNRILSVPILKNTCINCKYKRECNITKLTNVRKNNELMINSLVQLRKYIEDSIDEYYKILSDINKGLYSETYSYEFLVLEDVINKSEAIVFKTDRYGVTDQYTVEEYLSLYPDEKSKRKLVGTHKVKEVADVCYGLDINELLDDLNYVDGELEKLERLNTNEIGG